MARFRPACAIAATGRPNPHARHDTIGSPDTVCTTSCCSVHPPVSEAYARQRLLCRLHCGIISHHVPLRRPSTTFNTHRVSVYMIN